mmetsp:Transcript_53409/g.88728  ORF Transcript_53409/g.88728 Transcript_53409/m.88728 type:complete len:213 (+) Transcript_53409:507-1145(+)
MRQLEPEEEGKTEGSVDSKHNWLDNVLLLQGHHSFVATIVVIDHEPEQKVDRDVNDLTKAVKCGKEPASNQELERIERIVEEDEGDDEDDDPFLLDGPLLKGKGAQEEEKGKEEDGGRKQEDQAHRKLFLSERVGVPRELEDDVSNVLLGRVICVRETDIDVVVRVRDGVLEGDDKTPTTLRAGAAQQIFGHDLVGLDGKSLVTQLIILSKH